MPPKILADLSEDSSEIHVYFDYTPDLVANVKSVAGSRFVGKEKGGPYWRVQADIDIARDLSAKMGKEMRLTPRLRDWAKEVTAEYRRLAAMAFSDDAELKYLPEWCPEMYEKLRPYQRADIAYMAKNPGNLLNSNQPGLGKTWEAIGSVFESQTHEGPQLVIAPLTSLEPTWQFELERWQPLPVLVAVGGKRQREDIVGASKLLDREGTPHWLVINPAMVQKVRTGKVDKRDHEVLTDRFPDLYDVHWNNIFLDEIHKAGFRNPDSMTAKGLKSLNSTKRIAMSGTPIGGKPVNLFPILQYLHPEHFTSKWRWAELWLEIEDTGWGKNIGKIKEGLEDAFYKAHAPYLIRRTKAEVLTDLPPKQYQEIWVEMTPRQAKQYKEFAAEAEVRISEEETISATSILAEYTRLKQFAGAYCTVERLANSDKPRVVQTFESGKLAALEEILDERGVFDDEGVEEQIVIFSQFKAMAENIVKWLVEKKVPTLSITGDTKQKDRTAAQKSFQAAEVKVMVMTTTAGGVAITLDNADTVVFMDETWVPDDQEQAEDRVHRASRMHNVMVYTIRSKDTIEERIAKMVKGKQNVNEMILDLRRQGLKAV